MLTQEGKMNLGNQKDEAVIAENCLEKGERGGFRRKRLNIRKCLLTEILWLAKGMSPEQG